MDTNGGADRESIRGAAGTEYGATGETRVNRATAGDQWASSIATDGEGNVVVVWTGVDASDDGGSQFDFGGSSSEVGIEARPATHALFAAVPNPATRGTTIGFALSTTFPMMPSPSR